MSKSGTLPRRALNGGKRCGSASSQSRKELGWAGGVCDEVRRAAPFIKREIGAEWPQQPSARLFSGTVRKAQSSHSLSRDLAPKTQCFVVQSEPYLPGGATISRIRFGSDASFLIMNLRYNARYKLFACVCYCTRGRWF